MVTVKVSNTLTFKVATRSLMVINEHSGTCVKASVLPVGYR